MPPERRAVLLLLGLAVGGQALRMWASHPATAPGEATLLPELPGAASPTAHRDSAVALAKPLGPGETIDLDVAPALEIARLPRVGPRLAKVIVADREAKGPFGSLAALDRVPGVGVGLLATIAPHASFGGPPGPPSVKADPTSGGPGEPAGVGRAPTSTMNLNSASATDLEKLPFIGPGLALRIVAFRQTHGPFPAVDSLVRVPGIGPSVLSRVRDLVGVE